MIIKTLTNDTGASGGSEGAVGEAERGEREAAGRRPPNC